MTEEDGARASTHGASTDVATVRGHPVHFDPALYEATMAPWATLPSRSLGRPLAEGRDERTPHQRDRDRVIHATAFRRLKHKTQVFVAHEGDHFRTRLTHSLEVAQVARSIARALRLNEDLAEAIALAHDLGHPPFGHAGERALDACMAGRGGFDHNVQSLRVVTELERRYLAHDGLNLTWETLEGLAKHNGAASDPHPVIARMAWPADAAPSRQATLEAQVAAIADDIAYNAHDIDDGLRAGLFDLDELRRLGGIAALLDGIAPGEPRAVYELMRRQITMMVRDVVAATTDGLVRLEPGGVDDIRAADVPLVSFSPACRAYDAALRDFLWRRVYDHPAVSGTMSAAVDLIGELFEAFVRDPARLPPEWRERTGGASLHRAVADYIAGMTDTYARARHREVVVGI